MSLKFTFDLVGFVAAHYSNNYPDMYVEFIFSNVLSFLWATCLDVFFFLSNIKSQARYTKNTGAKGTFVVCDA